jgi:hypothetical protein
MSKPEIGKRLLTDLVDYYATTCPSDTFLEYPKSSKLDEWVTIDYETFKRAVDRMSWWLDDLFKTANGQTNARSVCYVARSDYRYFVLYIAAIRSNCKVRRASSLVSTLT